MTEPPMTFLDRMAHDFPNANPPNERCQEWFDHNGNKRRHQHESWGGDMLLDGTTRCGRCGHVLSRGNV